MLLDAQTFEIALTPEVALSLVQKQLASSGYRDVSVEQIRLFYTPFWAFTFDVEGTAQPISGKTAINASSGDVNEFVPALFDRPLNKTRRTAENVESEVEPTSVDRAEIEHVAQARVAAQLGVKKDQVAVSAFQKIYVPFYRVWITAGGNPLKAEVDGCLGATFGLEGLPKKAKTTDEITKETFEKLKSPSGWFDLAGKTVEAVVAALTGKEGPVPGMGKETVWLILGGILIVLLLFSVSSQSQYSLSCKLDPQFIRTDLNLIVYQFQSVKPGFGPNSTRFVSGQCSFKTKVTDGVTVCPQVYVRFDGNDALVRFPAESICARVVAGELATVKGFTIEWPESSGEKHAYEFISKT
jgi:hypothetical protein